MRPLLVALFAFVATAAPSAAGDLRTAKNPVAGSYIVVFKTDTVRSQAEPRSQRPLVAVAARQLAQAHGGSVSFVYQYALKGFAVRLAPSAATALAANPRVAYVETDQVVHAFGTQTPATWGIDRIDQRDLPLKQHLQLQPDRTGRSGLHHRHRYSRHASTVHRQDGERRRFRR